MGQEISSSQFDAAAFAEFASRLDAETQLLADLLAARAMDGAQRRFGVELESWLLDDRGGPAPHNGAFLDALQDAAVVPELARFNFEINSAPLLLCSGALHTLHSALAETWQRCTRVATGLALRPLLIGILPSLTPEHLTLENISPLQRYQAINDQIFRLRQGRPVLIDIRGRERLVHRHADVMLESATTSLQIHVEVDGSDAARAFNICKMLSAITVGIAANSPYLFGRALWCETRVPLFEQAVAVGGSAYSRRVTFGVRYAQRDIIECFEANRLYYPVLLPELMDVEPDRLAHLRLHNGTIWRWNRPLIGFDQQGAAHCRIEHRVAAAGPTPCDVVANTALFLGLFESMMRLPAGLEQRLPFCAAQDNFYAAARDGLAARLVWLDGRQASLAQLLDQALLPMAMQGLESAGLGEGEAMHWLSPIRGRVRRSMTGADWQMAWIDRNGPDFCGLVDAYYQQQAGNQPLHQWSDN